MTITIINNEDFFIQEITAALDLKSFYLDYQPQYNKNNEIIGMEALSRWINARGHKIFPEHFIKAIEKHHLIDSFGLLMIEKAFQFSYVLHKEMNIDFKRMGINISPLQLKNKNFIQELEYRRKNYQVNPKHINLEITESEQINTTEMFDVIKELHARGYEISIDDFGTGYSSFEYLMNMPLNELKLDRSFIQNIHLSKEKQSIVSSIINMASKLGIPVIAEGVETINELKFLIDNGCNNFQGYYFSRPLTSEQMILIAS